MRALAELTATAAGTEELPSVDNSQVLEHTEERSLATELRRPITERLHTALEEPVLTEITARPELALTGHSPAVRPGTAAEEIRDTPEMLAAVTGPILAAVAAVAVEAYRRTGNKDRFSLEIFRTKLPKPN